MEYTRSKSEHSYETFEGTPEEIAKLINAIDGVECSPTHVPIPVKKEVHEIGGLSTSVTVGFECSCGDVGCELHKNERG